MNKKAILFVLLVLMLLSVFSFVYAQFVPKMGDGTGGGLFYNVQASLISNGEGGTSIPVTPMDLVEQGNTYNMKPGRLKFEYGGELYAIQVRRVKEEYVDFLILTLNGDPEDITAYTLDWSFNLNSNEKKEIDVNNDGINDVSIELNEIVSTGEYGSIRFADFSIKKMNTKKSGIVGNEGVYQEQSLVVETANAPTTAISSESQELIEEPIELTFLGKITKLLKGLSN